MRRITCFWLVLLVLGYMLVAACGGAGALTTISLRSTRDVLLADGKQSTDLIAEVRDGARPVPNNTAVQFQTTAGTLSQGEAQTLGGVARIRLTSAPIPGIAHVTAFSPGGGNATLDFVFTNDPAETYEGNSYMTASANSYLAYSVTDRVIDAQGTEGGSHLTYRNLSLAADRYQLQCDTSVVRAYGNITLKRAGQTLHASRLYYNLASATGYAVTELKGHLQTAAISGETLHLEPYTAPLLSSTFVFPELQVKLIVTSKGITYFPGDRLQFRHAKFFQDQVQVLSLNFYELALHSTELFSDQFLSFGTSGLGLQVPFYYDLSPKSTGILTLRHQQPVGRGYASTSPGWSLDMIQAYNSEGGHRYQGSFGFTGLTRGDWGFRWSHNQEFNKVTQGNFYVDFPNHDSMITSANIAQQLRKMQWGVNVSSGQTLYGPSATSQNADVYTQTLPHPLAGSHTFQYTLGTTFSASQTHGADALLTNTRVIQEGINLRTYSLPFHLDKRTTLSDSFSIGQIWSSGGVSGPAALATLSLDRTLSGGSSMNITYDFVSQPGAIYLAGGKHRISINYGLASGKRFQANIFGSAFLDSPEASALADFVYRLDSQWRLLSAVTLQRYGGTSYKDMEFTIGRRIGARELDLTYSTLYKRIYFDMTSTRF